MSETSRKPLKAWILYNIVYKICCFPLKLYVDHLLDQPRHRHYPPSPTPYVAPSPLPIRTRQLSMTADFRQSGKQKKPTEQLQSRFFRLPKEIRLQIYQHAIGGRILHLQQGSKRKNRPYPRYHTCSRGVEHIAQSEWRNCATARARPARSLLPLLRTCRRVYTEVIYVLYSTNTFEFKDLNCLRMFLPTILPQCLQSLRAVRFRYTVPCYKDWFEEAEYESLWATFLSMPGLRDLRVKLSATSSPQTTEFWRRDENGWLTPLKRFRNLQVFEVYITLQRTERLPDGVNVGSCRLRAMDCYGVPFDDSALEHGS